MNKVRLGKISFVQKTSVECRVVNLPMMFKTYLPNEEEVFFGFYRVVERDVSINGKNMPSSMPVRTPCSFITQ